MSLKDWFPWFFPKHADPQLVGHSVAVEGPPEPPAYRAVSPPTWTGERMPNVMTMAKRPPVRTAGAEVRTVTAPGQSDRVALMGLLDEIEERQAMHAIHAMETRQVKLHDKYGHLIEEDEWLVQAIHARLEGQG